MFDLEMIRAVYERFPGRVAAARQATGNPLTLAEKILYTHLWEGEAKTAFTPVSYTHLTLPTNREV